MHWKALRIGTSDSNDSKRRSLVESHPLGRHSEQIPRDTLSTTNIAPRRSESTPRSPILTGPEDAEHNGESLGELRSNTPAARPRIPGAGLLSAESATLRRNRFSFMRLRHASDPQLSKTYAKGESKDVPPVPSLPPPTIITTAPTSHELDQPTKRKNIFSIFPDSKKSSVEDVPEEVQIRSPASNDKSRHGAQGSAATQTTDLAVSTSQIGGEESGRLSTTSIRSAGRDPPNDSRHSSMVDARFSESSRSDQSSGERGISRTNSPRDGSMASSKLFRLPRLKRHRSPLFPLPPRPTGVPSVDGRTPPDITPEEQEEDHISPLPSPSRSSVGLMSPRPPLLRKDSSNSTHSARSTPSIKARERPMGRARSSTLDSVINAQDTGQPSPHLTSSGRTSTSTSGRKSFGDIFSFSQRLRQNSEPPFPRNGSPGLKGSDTPTKVNYPERQEDDTPATYLSRLEETIPRGAIAGVLAQSSDDFYKAALRKYIRGFSFFGDPIDMAIRKLLMEVELPKETQQIDRFLQSFADRYHECNPGIFASSDQAYFIAFSILILHTDVFNKNNKRKMQKPDYVKNTGGEGISNDILECFYENILYTPFIHIEDPSSGNRHLAKPRRTLLKTASSDHLSRMSREPVDPYTLIMDGKLDSLRPSLKDVMNLEDTYRSDGTAGPPDIEDLHRAFMKSGILQIVSARSRPDAFMPASMENPADSHPGLVDIKVAKVGLLWRKDPKKKKTRSPWQEWGALLTLSQLYFFRDTSWIKSLMSQQEAHQKAGRRRAMAFKPPLTEFKPDGIISTHDAVALLDSSYKKHKHAFVLVLHNALEEVFLANSEADMNDWLAKLNYAATFRTTGVRTKGMIATNYEAQRNRMSRRNSGESNDSLSTDKEPPSPNPDSDVAEELLTARKQIMRRKIRETDERLSVLQKQLDELLRNARHLQVLTPVHSRAREHIVMSAGRMAAKLKWVRQEISRTKCYREVLIRDLGDDADQAEEQKPLHLQIPTIASAPSSTEDGSIDKAVSPTDNTPHQEREKSPSVRIPESQPGSPGARRPSIPLSFTSFDLNRPSRRISTDNLKERTTSSSPGRPNGLEREASVLSSTSRMDVSSLGSHASKVTASETFDDNEERLLRENGLLEVNSSPQARKQGAAVDVDADQKRDDASDGLHGDRSSRVRRSLHRTLRDSSGGHHIPHPRSKKSRESGVGAAAAAEDNQGKPEGEGLSRKSASFTVHGKKASIVTFGSEWQSMVPEERLKLRKPTPSDEPRASDPTLVSSGDSITSEPVNLNYPPSLRSASITTRQSTAGDEPAGSKDMAAKLYGEDKAKSEDAIRLATDPHTAASLGLSGPTFKEAAPLPSDDQPSQSNLGGPVDETTQQRMPPSPPEQAVNA
ncbi:hypothetical protein FE257_011830 [Aspergillus nanangensis]|uniref:Guanyl-nucleotide exchange factor n=1 Tax=Aspergillus nanangensis TaxID=2582783 RepID=A0AAD4GZ82_ASPNN|nr:hypothetical protein FE257_011830 [Aspergillus nanangensis]